MSAAFIISGLLLIFGVFSIYWQIKNLRTLRKKNIPSDDRRYRRKQAIFRLVNGFLLIVLASMIAGAFLSGMEQRATELGNRHDHRQEGEPRQPPSEEDRQLLRLYYWYWMSLLICLFLVLSIAIVDLCSTRLYGWAQLRRMQGEHRAILERDLAVYRQQKLNDRMKSNN